MRIQVLGPGCTKCKVMTKRTEDVTRRMGLDVAVEKVTEIQEIMKFGIMMTPALVIDGEVKFVGRVPTEGEIEAILLSSRN